MKPQPAATIVLLAALSTPVWASTQILMETTAGDIVLELYDEDAPQTVANFLAYVEDGRYEGTVFHRVIDGFMIQGGGYDKELKKVPSNEPITNEANNGRKNSRGSIAMARTSDPHSATNQFFINLVDNDFLNHTAESSQGWGYTAFGQVVEGMDVVDSIGKAQTGASGPFPKDVPVETILIEKVSIKQP
jgi:cyclophilin family peptidyl-prolyl cis-trans isomerase